MVRIVTLIAAVLLTLPAFADWTKEGDLGLGAEIGTMGSVSGKYFVMDQGAVDAGVEFLDHPWTTMYADFLWHFRGVLPQREKFWRESVLYVGAGAGVGFWDRLDTCGRWNCNWGGGLGTGTGLFIRAVGGLEWFPTRTHWGVFGEIAPSFMWYPGGASFIDVALGGRWYFQAF